MNPSMLIFIIVFVWLTALTTLAVWIFIYFKKLSDGVARGNLIKILESVIAKEKNNTVFINEISKQIINIQEVVKNHIQKIGVVRFNPFKELGGDHSFALAMLDGKDNGFIVTGLHTRERTRVYVKVIRRGKSVVELSREEKKALNEALK